MFTTAGGGWRRIKREGGRVGERKGEEKKERETHNVVFSNSEHTGN